MRKKNSGKHGVVLAQQSAGKKKKKVNVGETYRAAENRRGGRKDEGKGTAGSEERGGGNRKGKKKTQSALPTQCGRKNKKRRGPTAYRHRTLPIKKGAKGASKKKGPCQRKS